MNILFVTHRYPHPPNRGDRLRSFHFLERMARVGNVWLATQYDEEPSAESRSILGGLCEEVLAERWEPKKKWLRAGLSFLRGRTMTEGLFANPTLRHRLSALVRRVDFDVVVFFCSSVFQYAQVFQGISQPPLWMDFVDIDSQKFFDYAQKTAWWSWKRPILRREGQRLRQLEKRIETQCERLFAVTPEEVALFHQFCPTEKLVPISNGVDTAYFNGDLPELATVERIPYRCVFVGAMDYRANVDGAEWFLRQVLPGLRQQFPTCELDVVGSRPAPSLKRLCEETSGANLIGSVPDVRPYLQRAHVVVVPLQVARGIQNKVLEACSMRKATVVSPEAAEGIQRVKNGEIIENPPFLVCKTASEWVGQVAKVFKNDTLCGGLAEAGRTMVERSYGWDARLEVLERYLTEGKSVFE